MMIGIIYNKRAKRWLARVGTEHILAEVSNCLANTMKTYGIKL
jgi:hypothetical protein